jgi:hypothetical protein
VATAAEPALRDHWQRDIHACSESTLSHPEKLRNQKAQAGCANPVDVADCLWKSAEKMEEIGHGLTRKSKTYRTRKKGTAEAVP